MPNKTELLDMFFNDGTNKSSQKKLSFVPSKQNQVWTQDPLAAEPATNMNAFWKCGLFLLVTN